MGLLNQELLTLADYGKRLDPKGAIAPITEALTKQNAFLEDMVFQEGNTNTGHVFNSRTALPSISANWRKFNEGIGDSKSDTQQVTETCGKLEGKSKVDAGLVKLNGGPAFRASEDEAFVQAMSNEVETGTAYHSTKTAPEKFQGLLSRLESTTGPASKQIIIHDTGASGADQTSMLLVQWSPQHVYGIFPKGSMAGLQHEDMGKQIVKDANGKEYRAWVTWWEWNYGICVQDFTGLVAIRNIDLGNLLDGDFTLPTSMIKAYYKIRNPKVGRLAWYCNRTIATKLHLQAVNNTKNSTLSVSEIGGKEVVKFLGIPVRVTDGIVDNESPIS